MFTCGRSRTLLNILRVFCGWNVDFFFFCISVSEAKKVFIIVIASLMSSFDIISPSYKVFNCKVLLFTSFCHLITTVKIIRNHWVRVLVMHSIDIYAAFVMCCALCLGLGGNNGTGKQEWIVSVLTEITVENRDKISRQLLSRVILYMFCWRKYGALMVLVGGTPDSARGGRPNKKYFTSKIK